MAAFGAGVGIAHDEFFVGVSGEGLDGGEVNAGLLKFSGESVAGVVEDDAAGGVASVFDADRLAGFFQDSVEVR